LPFSYYIYYRVAGEQARNVVRDLQEKLHACSGVRGRVVAKRDDPFLWMEVYEGVDDPPAFEAQLGRLIEQTRFAQVLAQGSARKMECFGAEPCA
jgi:hypothetical protein